MVSLEIFYPIAFLQVSIVKQLQKKIHRKRIDFFVSMCLCYFFWFFLLFPFFLLFLFVLFFGSANTPPQIPVPTPPIPKPKPGPLAIFSNRYIKTWFTNNQKTRMIKFCNQKMAVPVCNGSIDHKTIMFNQFRPNGRHKLNIQFDKMNCGKNNSRYYSFQIGIIFLKKNSSKLHNIKKCVWNYDESFCLSDCRKVFQLDHNKCKYVSLLYKYDYDVFMRKNSLTAMLGCRAEETSEVAFRDGTQLTAKDVLSVVLDPPKIIFQWSGHTMYTVTITSFNMNDFYCYESISSMGCQCNNGTGNVSFKSWYGN